MKRALLPALMISLLLTACGGAGAEQKLEAHRDALAEAEEITFTAEITANLNDTVFECTLDCAAAPEEITAEVVAPDLIAGVKAHVAAGESTLSYNGVSLVVGSVGTEGLSPLGVVPILFTALKTGHVIRAWTEKDDSGGLVAAQIYADDNYDLTVWFSEDTLAPVHASLAQGGIELIRCEIRDFQFQSP